MPRIGADQIAHALVGMTYPAPRWQVVAWADYNGASFQLREAVRGLPEKIYTSLAEIVVAMRAQ